MPVRKDMMRQIANDIVNNIKSMIKTLDITYTGALENSFEAKEDGEDILIGSQLIYAPAVEFGRLPGKMPPVKVLFPWIVSKLGARNEKDAMNKAWAVARSIEKNGIPPQRYIRAALHNMEFQTA